MVAEPRGIGKKLLLIIIHFFVWMLLLLIPLIFIDTDHPHPPFIEKIIELVVMAVLFYVNFYYIIEKLWFKRKFLKVIFYNILLWLTLTGTAFVLIYLLTPMVTFPAFDFNDFGPQHLIPVDMVIYRLLVSFFLTTGLAIAIKATMRFVNEEDLRKKIEKEHLLSEISYLKYQLQPHFFFNTLNNIYALIDVKPIMAKEILHKLSKLMRYVLYHADETSVPLYQEVDFLKNYIHLMAIRTNLNTHIHSEFPEEILHASVPPLIFISLVENAFKHGVDATRSSIIYIKMEVDERYVILYVENSYFGKNDMDYSLSGIGLENLTKRLNLIYNQEDYIFTKYIKNSIYYSKLKIPKM
jgi:sensor histidine kinase YesM